MGYFFSWIWPNLAQHCSKKGHNHNPSFDHLNSTKLFYFDIAKNRNRQWEYGSRLVSAQVGCLYIFRIFSWNWPNLAHNCSKSSVQTLKWHKIALCIALYCLEQKSSTGTMVSDSVRYLISWDWSNLTPNCSLIGQNYINRPLTFKVTHHQGFLNISGINQP